ncbi:hypothetical protein ACJMK2_006129 [Sinanodonta woodiana]|uniref:MARVEL domain-containing protein n=1 Tax=Sinanodonta woodiana TaxID=1069815 RepID=A0ABD3VVP6_SINWO
MPRCARNIIHCNCTFLTYIFIHMEHSLAAYHCYTFSSAEIMAYLLGSGWIWIGLAQTILGFVTSTNCDANVDFPIFIGVHGLLNMIYWICIIPFVICGYKQFEFRIVFYFAWIAEGALCITGLVLYANTAGYLKGCNKDCKTCSRDLITGSVVIESLNLIAYILVTLCIIAYEIKTKCKHCKLEDGWCERGHDAEPHVRRQIRPQEARIEPATVTNGIDHATGITVRTSRNQITGTTNYYIQHLNV